jgi:N-acetyl-anhydromuramyl-L-alanine amidase AmpD
VAGLFGACADHTTTPDTAPAAEVTGKQLDAVFARAGAEFGVPPELLKAIGYAETGWQMVRGEQEFPGQERAFGIMALKGTALQRGAALARVSIEAASEQPDANIRAAAAVLSAHAEELRVNRADPGAWAPAVARYSGIADAEGQAAYVHAEVYAVLQRGVAPGAVLGEFRASLAPQTVTADFPHPASEGPALSRSSSTSSAASTTMVWRPSPNYSSRGSYPVHMVVLHSCESSYSSCWSWLTNSAAGASAHYVVNTTGSEISKLVYESNKAWHVGATYYCSRNNSTDCRWDGVQSNNFTVGIEHAGYASQTSWPSGQITESAALTCQISKRHNVPRDRNHIVSHARLQPYDRTDPGSGWPWTDYMNKVNASCGSAGNALIVDSNNNSNDTSKGYLDTGAMSSSWTSSTGVSGYYGTGYYHAPTGPVSDPATFWFYLPAAATKTIDAWWTSLGNRSTTAPFIAWDANGNNLGTVSVNQQVNGGKWNQLGTWNFTAGWNKIQLSRWTTAGEYVIADAVRIR